MNPNDPNILAVEVVAAALGTLREKLVFVGGSATGMLITDSARPAVRATNDVDLIAEVASVSSYYELQRHLKDLGFVEDLEVVCRWRIRDAKVDVMPTNEELLGFSNRWYGEAVKHASKTTLPRGIEIRLITAPYFIATKLEAFHGRGNGDYGASHDIEDVITLVDGRPALLNEIEACDASLNAYLVDEMDSLLADSEFVDSLGWHFAPDDANQARVEEVTRRLRRIARI